MATKAIIRIGALPDSSLKRALKGTVDASRKASGQVEASTKKAAKAGEVATRAEIEAAKRGMLDKGRTAESIARTEIRLAEKVARDRKRASEMALRAEKRAGEQTRREAEKTAQSQIKEAKRAQRERAAGRGRAGAAIIGGTVAGAVFGGVQVAQRGQSVARVGSQEEMLDTAIEFKKQMLLTAVEAKTDDGTRDQIADAIFASSKETNTSLLDYTDALGAAQASFDKFEIFGKIIPELAKIAAGKDMPLQELVSVLGVAGTGLGITDEKGMLALADVLISTAERGSIEAGPIAGVLGPLMADWTVKTGRTGEAAARELFATAQVLAKFNPTKPGVVGTQIEAFMSAIKGDKKTQGALRKAGVEVLDDKGELRQMSDIAAQMASSKKFFERVQTGGTEQGGLFGRKEAQLAAVNLATAVRDDPNALLSLQNIEAGQGLASSQSGLEKLQATSGFKLQNIGATAQVETAKDSDRIIEAMTPMVKGLTELQTEFPLLNASMPILTGAIGGQTAAVLAQTVLSRTAGGASVAGKLAGAGKVRKLGMAAAVAGAGAAGFMITDSILDATGGRNAIGDFFAGLGGPKHESGPAGLGASSAKKQEKAGPVELGASTVQAITAANKQNPSKNKLHIVIDGPGTVGDIDADGNTDMQVDSGMSGIAAP